MPWMNIKIHTEEDGATVLIGVEHEKILLYYICVCMCVYIYVYIYIYIYIYTFDLLCNIILVPFALRDDKDGILFKVILRSVT